MSSPEPLDPRRSVWEWGLISFHKFTLKSEVQQIHLLIQISYALSIYHMAAVVLGAEKIVGNKIFLAHKEFIQNDREWE